MVLKHTIRSTYQNYYKRSTVAMFCLVRHRIRNTGAMTCTGESVTIWPIMSMIISWIRKNENGLSEIQNKREKLFFASYNQLLWGWHLCCSHYPSAFNSTNRNTSKQCESLRLCLLEDFYIGCRRFIWLLHHIDISIIPSWCILRVWPDLVSKI